MVIPSMEYLGLHFKEVHFLVELLQESVVLVRIFMLHFVCYQMTRFWAKHKLEFPIYWAILPWLSFSFKRLLVGVSRKELTFRMKNGRVGHGKWFLPPPCFPKILCNANSGLYYREGISDGCKFTNF